MEKLGKRIDDLSNQLVDLRLELWKQYSLFTWKWWMLLIICILSLIIFLVLIRRDKMLQSIAYFGLLYILNRNLDDVATAMDWYDYRIQLEPIIPTMLPANLFVIPISFTLLYQKFINWKSFLIALILFSGSVAYIALPFMKYLDIYLIKHWNAHLSFISLIIMASLSKLIIDKAKAIQEKSQ
jgi:hypothetical protein